MRRRVFPGPTRTRLQSMVLFGTTAFVALFAAGCGSSSSTTSGGASSTASSATTTPAASGNPAIQAILAKATAPISSWAGFQKPFHAPTGKHIVAIECSALGVGCVQAANAAEEAGAVLGWNVNVVNGQGDPSVWSSAVQNAVAAKVDGIMLIAISPALIKQGVAQAKAAGIPVVATLVGPPADAAVVADPNSGGKAMAAYLASASGGKGDFLVLNDAEFVLTDIRNKAMVKDLGSFAAGVRRPLSSTRSPPWQRSWPAKWPRHCKPTRTSHTSWSRMTRR
jgi:ribose transport system substrate-binding protein